MVAPHLPQNTRPLRRYLLLTARGWDTFGLRLFSQSEENLGVAGEMRLGWLRSRRAGGHRSSLKMRLIFDWRNESMPAPRYAGHEMIKIEISG